jgi:hypothetical protein
MHAHTLTRRQVEFIPAVADPVPLVRALPPSVAMVQRIAGASEDYQGDFFHIEALMAEIARANLSRFAEEVSLIVHLTRPKDLLLGLHETSPSVCSSRSSCRLIRRPSSMRTWALLARVAAGASVAQTTTRKRATPFARGGREQAH